MNILPLSLRPYQDEAIAAVQQAATRGIQRPLISLPTGTGKTVIFSHLVQQRPGRSLILAHRDELIAQAVDKLLLVNPLLDVGVIKAARDEHHHHVIVGSVQTLARQSRLDRLAGDFATIVVDEAHHATADSYRRILEQLGAFDANGPLTLGVTATPERADGASLGNIWQEIIYRKTILEMIGGGYLADLRAIQIQLAVDFNAFHISHGDYRESDIERLFIDANAPALAAEAYQEHAFGRKALVFTPTVKTAYAMAGAFQEAGVAAEAFDGSTRLEDRRAILARFHSGATQVLANCAVLTEGFDEPSIDCIIVARPTKSKPLYVQMIGRGTRLYPGKDDCLILDLVGSTSRHDLVTASSLFGVDPEILAKKTISEAITDQQSSQEALELPTEGTLVAVPVDLFKRRPLHWVQATHGAFVLSLGEGFLSLQPHGDRWDVVRLHPEAPREILASGLSLAYAQGVAEDHAREAGAGGLVNPKARWRAEPATDGQLRLMKMMRIPITTDLTKGQAADLITAAKAAKALRGVAP